MKGYLLIGGYILVVIGLFLGACLASSWVGVWKSTEPKWTISIKTSSVQTKFLLLSNLVIFYPTIQFYMIQFEFFLAWFKSNQFKKKTTRFEPCMEWIKKNKSCISLLAALLCLGYTLVEFGGNTSFATSQFWGQSLLWGLGFKVLFIVPLLTHLIIEIIRSNCVNILNIWRK